MSFDVEVGFISKLLQTKDIISVKDNQIKVNYFSGESKSAYQFIYDTILTTGEVPTVRAFKRKFPRYTLETTYVEGEKVVGTEENLKFWCDELRTKVKHNSLAEMVGNVAGKLQEFSTEEAYNMLKKEIAYIESEVVETSDVDLTKGGEDRILAYLDRKNNKGMRGIPTGFSHLDYILKGLEKETLTTFIANTGVGKANPISTPVLTPEGFIPMANVKVNSLVIGEDGEPYRVTAIHPQGFLDVYELTFSDGSKSRCSAQHLWKFKTIDDLQRGKEWRVQTLEELMKLPLKRGRGYNIHIPVNKAVKFSSSHLPIDPYVLGCLLGDGVFTTDHISFTTSEEDIVERMNDNITAWGEFVKCTSDNYQYMFKSNDPKCSKLYRSIKDLGLVGKSSIVKFIPQVYLHASIESRCELLAGLFDTDGHVCSNNTFSYNTFSKKLASDVIYLCRSLGIRTTLKLFGEEYRVTLLTNDLVGYSNKHYERFSSGKQPKVNRKRDLIKVVSIEKIGVEECQCISVDSKEHTYICDDFIVTHNTWVEIVIGANCQLQNYRVLQFVTEMSEDIMRDRYEAVLFAKCYNNLNYNAFKSGSLSKEVEEQYFNFLRNDLPHFEPLIIATATGVMGVSAAIDKYDPDIVLIDSAYLMEDDQGSKEDWLRVAHITRDLKKLAKRCKKPIIINTQADKNTSKKTGPELGSIMFTQAIGQDSDNVIALFRDEVMINDREMGIKVLKQREGSLGKLTLNWDFETMNFSEIFMEQDSEDLAPTNTLDVL